jgi:hypothetical protein
MKGEQQRRDAGNGQSTSSFLTRPVTLYRSRRDREAFASAERKYTRYSALAREASLRGDIVAMENFYQHAEHYFRVIRSTIERRE